MGLRITTALFAFMMAIGILTGLRLSHAEPTTTAPNTSVTGIISQVSGDRITLQTSGHTISFAMPRGTPIKVSGQPATAADLKVGMSAIVISTDGKTAVEVRAYPPTTTKPTTHPTTEPTTKPTTRPTTEPANHNYTGVITQVNGDGITIQSSGHTTTFKITSSTTIKIGDHVGTVADLKVGMSALVVSSDGKTAIEIHAYQPTTTKPTTHPTTEPTTKPTTPPTTKPVTSSTFTGTITQVRGDGLTLESPPHTASFSFTHATKITINGQPATGADLKVGMKAGVTSTDGKVATEIRAYSVTTTTK